MRFCSLNNVWITESGIVAEVSGAVGAMAPVDNDLDVDGLAELGLPVPFPLGAGPYG